MKLQNESMNRITEDFLQILHDHHFKVTKSLFDLTNRHFKEHLPFLGTAYEIFCSKNIQSRKSDGVYYTPQYVVDYIVQNTVGKLLDGKTPKDATKIKIVDPACGCGNFLLGAYQYLLDWHLNFYTQYTQNKINRPRGLKTDVLTPDGKLTTSEKKRILLNNIYGVDIDMNAVEVTKLSLLLKCMEGEMQASIEQQRRLFHDRVLPPLESNILCGNSLIDTDFYDEQLDFGDEKKIKPFNWQHAFPNVFAKGGKFDVVMGNPPYVKVTNKIIFDYFNRKFIHQDYQKDLYLLFLEQYKNLLTADGTFGVIIPNTWLQSLTFRNIRKYLMNEYYWERILHFNEYVFKAVVDTHILVFKKNNREKNNAVAIDIYEKETIRLHQTVNQNKLPDNGDVINILSRAKEKRLVEKIRKNSIPVQDICTVYNGVKPFEKGKGTPPQTAKIMKEKPYVFEGKNIPKGKNWLPLLRGSLIHRYANFWNHNSWIQYGQWLAAPRNPAIFEAKEKIIVRQTGDSIIATIIGGNIICKDNLHIVIGKKINHKFILGILNSKLIDFFYYQINPEKGEALAQVKKNHVEQLPLPILSAKTKKQYNNIIKLVDQLLKLNVEKSKTKLQTNLSQIESKIAYCESRINLLVYQLYGLGEEEIEIVERE